MDTSKERVRETFSSGLVNLDKVYWGHRKTRSFPHPMGVRVTHSESIDYGTGALFNECSATKSRIYAGWPASRGCLSSVEWYVKAGSSVTGSKPEPRQMDSVFLTVQPKGSAVISATMEETQQARFEAYQKLIYLIDVEHMNFARSFFELKDTKATLKPFISFFKWSKANLGKKLPGAIGRKLGKLSVASSCAKMASAYLWYKFGVEPTISDVNRFTSEVSSGKLSVQGRKNPLRVPKGAILVSRYSVNPGKRRVGEVMFKNLGEVNRDGGVVMKDSIERSWPNYSTYHTFPNPFPDGSVWVQPNTVTAQYERGAYFAEVIRDIEVDATTQLSRQMAWNCPMANTAWELVPFSFVVDWFVDVGKYIHNLEKLSIGVSERQKLGPIWHSVQIVTDTYRPSLDAANWAIEGIAAPSDQRTGGIVRFSGEWECSPSLEDRVISFERHPSSKPALPALAFARQVKAYQITTGMALLAQAALG